MSIGREQFAVGSGQFSFCPSRVCLRRPRVWCLCNKRNIMSTFRAVAFITCYRDYLFCKRYCSAGSSLTDPAGTEKLNDTYSWNLC